MNTWNSIRPSLEIRDLLDYSRVSLVMLCNVPSRHPRPHSVQDKLTAHIAVTSPLTCVLRAGIYVCQGRKIDVLGSASPLANDSMWLVLALPANTADDKLSPGKTITSPSPQTPTCPPSTRVNQYTQARDSSHRDLELSFMITSIPYSLP